MNIAIRRAAAAASAILLGASAAVLLGVAPVSAQPTNLVVVQGDVTPVTVGTTLTLTQTTDVAILEADGFIIGSDETLEIVAPSESAITVIRVVDAGIVDVAGTVTSTGSLILMTPNGIDVIAGGEIAVDGDLLLISGDAPDSEFSETDPEFTVDPDGDTVLLGVESTVTAGGSVLLASSGVDVSGFLSTADGDIAEFALPIVGYDRELREFVIVDNSPMAGAFIEVKADAVQLATNGRIVISSSAPDSVVHNGYSEADNSGRADAGVGIQMGGGVSSDGFSAYATASIADGGSLGARLFSGDPVPLSFSTLTESTAGGAVPAESAVVVTSLSVALVEASVIQTACGLEGDPLQAHWAMAVPSFDGAPIVPSIDPYSAPNLPAVVVPGLGTVTFNEQTVQDIDGYRVLSVTGMRIVTEEGDEYRIAGVECGVALPAPVLPATGAESGAALAAALLLLLAGVALVSHRRRNA